MSYYMGDDSVSILNLLPGDSFVVPRRIVLECINQDMELHHGSLRVLVIGRSTRRSHSGLTVVNVYVLTPHDGVAYIRRSTQEVLSEGEQLPSG